MLLAFLLVCLSACTTCNSCRTDENPSTSCCARTTCNTCNSCWQIDQAFICNLQAKGIKIIQIGDTVRIVMPSDYVFEDGTSVINECYYAALNQVASYLCCKEKIIVKVTSYTDACGSQARNLALSRQQAQTVADYLWKAGIDTRALYAVGAGGCDPIACNNTRCGRAMNRRIEITLRRITDYYDY